MNAACAKTIATYVTNGHAELTRNQRVSCSRVASEPIGRGRTRAREPHQLPAPNLSDRARVGYDDDTKWPARVEVGLPMRS